ncbi:protein singles bar [Condylostylus longicornis]|uniref:protein singles bar n=1 Tax=Condylostylus longicornis TaxID=2530218 RepID=UPI00244DB44F|nr:protein singles bar [Condylostylus longicornis]
MSKFGIRGPTINERGGINICCCRVCTCINFSFIVSKIGIIKGAEVLLAAMCETLLIRYGIPYASSIGQALTSFLTATACCFTTSSILLFCYCFSEKSYNLIRQSFFEILFNGIACFLYLSASSYMGFATVVYLHPQFLITPGFMAYPAMTAVYYMGYVAALAHGVDCFFALKFFRRHG